MTMTQDVVFEAVRRNVLEVLPDITPQDVSMKGTLTDLAPTASTERTW